MKDLGENRDEIRLILAAVAMHALIISHKGHPESVDQAFFLADEMLKRAEQEYPKLDPVDPPGTFARSVANAAIDDMPF